MFDSLTDPQFQRLATTPGSADSSDVTWLIHLVKQYDAELRVLAVEDVHGRLHGLEEAADILDQAAGKAHTVRFLQGRKEQFVSAVNGGFLRKCARIVRQYAEALRAQGLTPEGSPRDPLVKA